MTERPPLFDRNAIARNRARSRRDALFLHDRAADEIEERLKEVNRAFTDPVVVSGHPAPWARFGPVVPDDEILTLQPASHDLVIHGLSLHWANDPVGQLIQCRRALRPDGLLLAALLGGTTLQELRACLAEAEAQVSGGLSPRVIPMGEIRDLGGLLQRAGFALPVADSEPARVEYASAMQLMHDLRAMGEGNAMSDRHRGPTARKIIDEAVAKYQAAHPAPSGRIYASFETIFLTGWAPSADQPQPMRPGSAQARLADALGTTEQTPGKMTND